MKFKTLLFFIVFAGIFIAATSACNFIPSSNELPTLTLSEDPTATPPEAETLSPTATPVLNPTPINARRQRFADEFDGTRITTSKWQTQYWWGRTNPPEAQYYAPDAFDLSQGVLRIKAERRSMQGKQYTSGLIASYGKFSFMYGYIEIRARIPVGKGLWPALWLLANNHNSKSEIDIMEILGDAPHRLYATLTYNGAGGRPQESQGIFDGSDFSADFHVYSLDWSSAAIVWYVDGAEVFRVTKNVPHEPMYLIANLAIGGTWPGYPDTTTKFPAFFDIDYIRVYQ